MTACQRTPFFSAMHKNQRLIFICPIYTAPQEFAVRRGGVALEKVARYVEDAREPIRIVIYAAPVSPSDAVDVADATFEVTDAQGCVHTITLEHIITSTENTLALTTLFKDDHALLPLFYNWYRSNGVDAFYLYYNGVATDAIRRRCDLPGVVLIDWNFQYWNDATCKYKHHAQMGQMHDALYRFGKDQHRYMIFCDLDEYLYNPRGTLSELARGTDVDAVAFCNRWSTTLGGEQPPLRFPTPFHACRRLRYGKRSKCMHNTATAVTLHIHTHRTTSLGAGTLPRVDASYDMFHFVNWSRPHRVTPPPQDNDAEECVVYLCGSRLMNRDGECLHCAVLAETPLVVVRRTLLRGNRWLHREMAKYGVRAVGRRSADLVHQLCLLDAYRQRGRTWLSRELSKWGVSSSVQNTYHMSLQLHTCFSGGKQHE